MKRILFYISGHGYGHATRNLEVIKTIQLIEPSCHIHIQTNAPEWLISLNLQKNYKFIPKACDIGAVQKNSYDVEQEATLKSFAKFYTTFEKRLLHEIDYIRKNKIDLIVGDIPPLAFLVAKEANVSSIAITNFSWDWIYQPYTKNFPEYKWIVDEIRRAYRKANLLLRLPFYKGLSAFPKKFDIPMIARKAWISEKEVRKKIAINPDKKIVLVTFRKEDIDQINFKTLSKLSNFTFLFFSPVPQYSNFMSLKADFLPFPNLVAASDLVISKPGYGIVSECFVNNKPLLYTPRKNFREYGIFANELTNLKTGMFISRNDFLNGNWEPYISKLLESKAQWPDWPSNGAEVAAKIILEY